LVACFQSVVTLGQQAVPAQSPAVSQPCWRERPASPARGQRRVPCSSGVWQRAGFRALCLTAAPGPCAGTGATP